MVECKELIKKIKSKQLVNEKIEYEHIFKDTQKQKNIIMMFTQLLKIRQNKNEENCPSTLQNQNCKVLKNGINVQNCTNLSFGKWNKKSDISEFLIRRGVMAHNETRLSWPYFCILNLKIHINGLEGHKSWPTQGPWPALVLHWSLNGPSKGPCDFLDSLWLSLSLLQIHSPTLIMSLVFGNCGT